MTLPRYGFEILPEITISTAATVNGIEFALRDVKHLQIEALFVRDGGGTDVQIFVQTSLDGGVTFFDIMNIRFTTSSGNRISSVFRTSVAASITPTDAGLAANQVINGLIGDRVKVKVVSTGTYTGPTTLQVVAVAHK